MNLTIKDLKKLNAEQEISGFPLLIKTARNAFRDADENVWQEVVFMDASGEIVGHILIDPGETEYKSHIKRGPASVLQSKQRICAMKATIQDTDIRKKEGVKIVITEWFDLAVNLTFDQRQELQVEDWKKLREDEIKGKIRHGLCCAVLSREHPAVISKMKKDILEVQDFIMTGK